FSRSDDYSERFLGQYLQRCWLQCCQQPGRSVCPRLPARSGPNREQPSKSHQRAFQRAGKPEASQNYSQTLHSSKGPRTKDQGLRTSRSSFHKRDLVDLLQIGDPQPHFFNGRLSQRNHALLVGGAPDLRGGALIQDQLTNAIGKRQQFPQRGAAAKARLVALGTAHALVERYTRPSGWIQAGLLKEFHGRIDRLFARFTNHAYQALRQDAIERGNKVIGLNAHVQEAAQYIDDVVGVHGGEHQMPRQSGLDGNLRRFIVADLAHHDLVRIVPQDGAQSPSEGQPFFLVDGYLGDAADLVLDRVLNGDDLVLFALDFRERRVQRGGFAAAGGTGHQHHAVRLPDEAAKTFQFALGMSQHVEPELAKLLAQRFLVEDAQHGVLAVDGGHDGDAEIDRPAAVAHPEAAVLGNAPLGDVEFGHDLDAGDQRGLVLARQR